MSDKNITDQARDIALQQGGIIGDLLRQLADSLDACRHSLAYDRGIITQLRHGSDALACERDEAIHARKEAHAESGRLAADRDAVAALSAERFHHIGELSAELAQLQQKHDTMADQLGTFIRLKSGTFHVIQIEARIADLERLQREYGTMAASVDHAYTVLGAANLDRDPDARDPYSLGQAVERALYLRGIQIRSLESSLAACREMGRQAQREADSMRPTDTERETRK